MVESTLNKDFVRLEVACMTMDSVGISFHSMFLDIRSILILKFRSILLVDLFIDNQYILNWYNKSEIVKAKPCHIFRQHVDG